MASESGPQVCRSSRSSLCASEVTTSNSCFRCTVGKVPAATSASASAMFCLISADQRHDSLLWPPSATLNMYAIMICTSLHSASVSSVPAGDCRAREFGNVQVHNMHFEGMWQLQLNTILLCMNPYDELFWFA